MYCTGSTLPTRSCVVHEVEQRHEALARRPRRERQERRAHVDPVGPQHGDGARRVGRRVSLVEPGEGRIVDRLEGGDDEEAPGAGEVHPHAGVPQHVLDLHGAVEGERRMGAVHALDDPPARAAAR